jgi:cell division protein FtsW
MAKRIGVDKWIFFTTLTLVVVGLAMVFSASAIVAQERFHSPYAVVGRQAGWALAGVLLMVALMSIDYEHYNSPRFIFTGLAITTVLLVIVFFFRNAQHAHRWILFGGFSFQPSEIAKPVLILFLAWFLSKRLDSIGDWRHTLLRAAIMPVVFILLIVKQPDLGTALVLAGVTAMMLMLAGMEWKYLVAAIAVALPPLAALLFWVPWRRARMLAFVHPDLDPQGAGFHINQSLIAVGTGGLTGRGFMEGMQKLFYLPEASTDFIFANVAEELGFLGAMCHRRALLRPRLPRAAHRLPVHRSLRAPHRIRHHDCHPAASLLQYLGRPLAPPHQGDSAPLHLLRRNLALLHAGQHRHPPQHLQKGRLSIPALSNSKARLQH